MICGKNSNLTNFLSVLDKNFPGYHNRCLPFGVKEFL